MSKKSILIVSALSLFMFLSCSDKKKSESINDPYKLVWADEFDVAGKIDSTKWNYENGFIRNREDQYYTGNLNNLRVENGHLIMEAHKEKYKNEAFRGKDEKYYKFRIDSANYTAPSLTTRGLATWKYGKFEVRAKLAGGVGLWPAIWMLGENYSEVGWPKCGELDIMEYVGFDKDTIFATIHTEAYNHTKNTQKGKKTFINKPMEEFHIFGMEWTPEKIDFLLDGKVYNHIANEYKTTDEWPFDQEFHLKINIAIGGFLGGKKGIDDSVFPQQMLVDYVRVYQLK